MSIFKTIAKKVMGDCPLELIPLIGKAKPWREAASKVLIEFDHRFKRIEIMMGACLTLSTTILLIIVRQVI